jgi:hypothetical protein
LAWKSFLWAQRCTVHKHRNLLAHAPDRGCEFRRAIKHHGFPAKFLGLVRGTVGTQLPGPGTIYLNQSLHFGGPVGLGDTITVTVKVAVVY